MRAAFFPAAGLLLASSFLSGALAQRAQGVLPLDRILPEIRRTHPGQFYDADGPSPGPNGSQHYHLKWMTPDGRIEWLDTDARTGRVLRSSPGRDSFDAPVMAPAPRSAPEAPDYRGRFVGGEDGVEGNDRNDRGPGGFYPRGGPDYGIGRDGRDYRSRGNGDNRDAGGGFRER